MQSGSERRRLRDWCRARSSGAFRRSSRSRRRSTSPSRPPSSSRRGPTAEAALDLLLSLSRRAVGRVLHAWRRPLRGRSHGHGDRSPSRRPARRARRERLGARGRGRPGCRRDVRRTPLPLGRHRFGTKSWPIRDSVPRTLDRWRLRPTRPPPRRRDPQPHGVQQSSWRRRRCHSASATSAFRWSSSCSRRVAASASSDSRTRPTGPPAEGPSRCGRAISSDCGRRSNARPSSARRWERWVARPETATGRPCGAPQAGTSARCAAAASTRAASRSPPSADPRRGSTACSGWGISPMTLPVSLTTPATLPSAPFTSSV